MRLKSPAEFDWRTECERLEARLAELEGTLHAISHGEVDAVVVEGPKGVQIFSLRSSEEPYRILAERMNEGAATLTAEGTILYCNPRLAGMVGVPGEKLVGQSLVSLLHDEDRAAFTECALQARRVDARVESRFRREDGSTLPVQLSLSAIPLQEAGDGLCLVATDLSEQKRVEKLLDAVIENIPDSVFLKDAQSLRYLMLNRGSETVLGIPREELLGKTDYEYFSEAEAAFFRAKDREALRTGKLLDIPEESVITAGKQRWLHVRKIPLFAANGRPEYLLGISEDITERKQWEEMRSRLVAIVESSDYAIIGRSFDNTITSWNSAAERLFGFAPDEMIGKSMWLLVPTHRFDEESQILERSRNGERIESFETVRRRKDGSDVHVSLTLSIIRDASGASTGISTIARDITPMRALIQAKNAAEAVNEQTAAAKRRLEHEVLERKRAEQKLRYVAYHDTLTGLPNRALFLSALAKALRRMRRHPRRGVAVLFLDLDRFKVVNDSLGHDAGDALLVALAGRLAGCVRPYDTLARMGGDEFTILLDDIGCAGDAVALAERIIEALKRPFEVAGHVIFSSTSIGIALAGSGSNDADAMLRDADTAMYRAKQRGGGHYELFVHELHVQAMARLELETDLRRALARGELHLAYQPIVALENGRLTGFEALARWHHPQHGEIPPGVFVPLAE